jgi:hypothetical protein
LVFSGLLLGVTFCAEPVALAQTDGLLLYLPFDECGGDTTAATEGPDGTLVNSPQWVDGNTAGCALEFDGTSNFVEVPVDPLDDPFSPQSPVNQGQITICAWVNVLAVATDAHGQGRQPIVMKGNSNEWEYALYVYDDFGAGMSIWDCAGNGVSEPHAPGTLPQEEWHHVCGTFDVTDGVTVYVDAVQVTQQPPGANQPCDGTRSVFIAHREDGQFLRAVIDDIGIWDRVLDEGEILAVMEGALTEDPTKVTVSIKRDIPDTLINGTSGVVTLTVTPRFGSGVVVINEKLPAGLTPSNPSHNGVVAGDAITWNLGRVDTQIVVSYTMTAALDAANAKILSTATLDGVAISIGGDTSYKGSPITSNGFIKLWNHLGPLAWAYPSAPGDHGDTFVNGACSTLEPDPVDPTLSIPVLSRDWIVNADGSLNESNIVPFPGMLVRPKYGGDGNVPGGTGARAAGLTVAGGDAPPPPNAGLVVRDRFPVWRGSLSPGDTIDHSSPQVNGIDAEDHLTMSCAYVMNNTGSEIVTQVGIGSDDSIQIFINDEDITVGDQGIFCRPWGAANEEQNTFPAILKPGENRVLVKVSDGYGGSGFRLRFQDPEGAPDPITGFMPGLLPPKITVRLESDANKSPGSAKRTLAKTSFAQGEAVPVTVEVDLKTGSDVIVKETLPAGGTAAAISDGGTLNGDTVQWNLKGVQKKSVSYEVTAPICPSSLVLLQGSITVGGNEVETTGPNSATRVYGNDDLGAWTSRDLGATAGGGADRLGDHELLVKSVGAGIASTKDDFRFISIPASGDVEISTRIDCVDDPNYLGMAGVMMRNGDDPGSANVFFGFLPSRTPGTAGTLRASLRNDGGKFSRTISPLTDKDVDSLPIYLKIARTGAKVSFQRSADGVAYTEVANRDIVNVNPTTNQVNLANDLLIGLAATGAAADNSVRVNFTKVSGPAFSGLPPGKRFRRGDVDASNSLDISDAVGILGYLFLGEGVPNCREAADTDNSGDLDISDAVNNLSYQFLGGQAPEAPGPADCGLDPKDPFLGCDAPCP